MGAQWYKFETNIRKVLTCVVEDQRKVAQGMYPRRGSHIYCPYENLQGLLAMPCRVACVELVQALQRGATGLRVVPRRFSGGRYGDVTKESLEWF